MAALVRLIERITVRAGLIIAWVVFPLILATCYEVFSRYALNAPTIWAFELGYMTMGVHALIGAAYALRERSHIRIDVFYTHFSDRTKAIIDTAGYVFLFMPAVCWLTYALWDYLAVAYLSGERSGQSAWNPVIWPFRLAFFLGYLLLALQGVAELIKCVRFLAGRTKEWDAG